jgi:hypothetical protein
MSVDQRNCGRRKAEEFLFPSNRAKVGRSAKVTARARLTQKSRRMAKIFSSGEGDAEACAECVVAISDPRESFRFEESQINGGSHGFVAVIVRVQVIADIE